VGLWHETLFSQNNNRKAHCKSEHKLSHYNRLNLIPIVTHQTQYAICTSFILCITEYKNVTNKNQRIN